MPEYILLVDENDQVVGQEEKLKAHQEALLHRAFSVFVWRKNSQGQLEILLQQRQENKYHSGGLWTNTCCSHPRINETILEAGERRLREESGIRLKLDLLDKFYYKAVFKNGLTEHEWDYVLAGQWQEQPILANPVEAKAYQWQSVSAIDKNLKLNPASYTPWFEEALNIFIKKIGNKK